jgi:hypothetical protein
MRLIFLSATAAIALAACGSNEDPAANAATNDLNAIDLAVEQNAASPEADETTSAAEPVADAPEPQAAPAPAPAPKKAAPAKPAPAPELKPAEPEASDPTCAPEHRAAGHC